MILGLVLKYRNGLRFVIRRGYATALPALNWFSLTRPGPRLRTRGIAVNIAERYVSRQLRLAHLAPEVLKRLVFGREVTAVTIIQLTEWAALPWVEHDVAPSA